MNGSSVDQAKADVQRASEEAARALYSGDHDEHQRRRNEWNAHNNLLHELTKGL